MGAWFKPTLIVRVGEEGPEELPSEGAASDNGAADGDSGSLETSSGTAWPSLAPPASGSGGGGSAGTARRDRSHRRSVTEHFSPDALHGINLAWDATHLGGDTPPGEGSSDGGAVALGGTSSGVGVMPPRRKRRVSFREEVIVIDITGDDLEAEINAHLTHLRSESVSSTGDLAAEATSAPDLVATDVAGVAAAAHANESELELSSTTVTDTINEAGAEAGTDEDVDSVFSSDDGSYDRCLPGRGGGRHGGSGGGGGGGGGGGRGGAVSPEMLVLVGSGGWSSSDMSVRSSVR